MFFRRKEKEELNLENELLLKELIKIPYATDYAITKSELISDFKSTSSISKAFKDLKTNIQFLNINNKNKHTFLITSPYNKDGKSFVASNMAIAFAEIGKKVILIDADLNTGRLGNIFNIPNNLGLSNYLSGLNDSGIEINYNISNFINNTRFRNINLITSGTIPPNSTEILSSSKLPEVIEELSLEYDVIIFDGTSILDVADSLILSRLISSTILVINSNNIKIDDLKSGIKDIKNIGGKVLGFIVNNVETDKKKLSYYLAIPFRKVYNSIKSLKQKIKKYFKKKEIKLLEEGRTDVIFRDKKIDASDNKDLNYDEKETIKPAIVLRAIKHKIENTKKENPKKLRSNVKKDENILEVIEVDDVELENDEEKTNFENAKSFNVGEKKNSKNIKVANDTNKTDEKTENIEKNKEQNPVNSKESELKINSKNEKELKEKSDNKEISTKPKLNLKGKNVDKESQKGDNKLATKKKTEKNSQDENRLLENNNKTFIQDKIVEKNEKNDLLNEEQNSDENVTNKQNDEATKNSTATKTKKETMKNNSIDEDLNSNSILVIVDVGCGVCRAFNKYCYTEKLARGLDPKDGFVKEHYSSFSLKRKMEGLMALYNITKKQAKRIDPLVFETLCDFDEFVWTNKKLDSDAAGAYVKSMSLDFEKMPSESNKEYNERCKNLRLEELKKLNIEVEYNFDSKVNISNTTILDKIEMRKFANILGNKKNTLKENETLNNIVKEDTERKKEEELIIKKQEQEKKLEEKRKKQEIRKEKKKETTILRKIKKEKDEIRRKELKEKRDKKRKERNRIREENKRIREIERQKQKEEARIEEELLIDNLYPKTKNNKDI